MTIEQKGTIFIPNVRGGGIFGRLSEKIKKEMPGITSYFKWSACPPKEDIQNFMNKKLEKVLKTKNKLEYNPAVAGQVFNPLRVLRIFGSIINSYMFKNQHRKKSFNV